MKKIKIFLVIGNNNLREAIQTLIEVKIGYLVVGSISNPLELLSYSNICSSDVIILDMSLEESDAFLVAKQLLENNHRLNILALSMNNESLHLLDLVFAGFKGCVMHNKLFEDLESAIIEIINGGLFYPNNIKL